LNCYGFYLKESLLKPINIKQKKKDRVAVIWGHRIAGVLRVLLWNTV
jgi:hypothetical protein